MEVISKAEAIKSGSHRYFTGKPCRYGHICERYVSSGICTICSKQHYKNNYSKEKDKKYRCKYYKHDVLKYLLNNASSRAKIKCIEFNINKEDIPNIGEYCPVFGIKYTFNMNIENRETAPSLDRIDPSKGYVPGNVCVISRRANSIKNNATLNELEAIVCYMRQRTTK